MLDYDDFSEILSEISCGDWLFYVGTTGQHRGDGFYLQIKFMAPDMVTKEMEQQSGRKWQLSPHMTKSEVVSTALKAVLTAVEHEARESFRYCGQAIFAPHFDVDALAEFSRHKENIDMRTGAWVAV